VLRMQGKTPEEIPHTLRPGCGCAKCKTKRGEYDMLMGDEPSSEIHGADSTQSRLPIHTEKFIARILNIPNRIGELFCRLKKLPQEVCDTWKADQAELDFYGQSGKEILQSYIPEFKHDKLVYFASAYLASIGERVMGMIMAIKIMEEQNTKEKKND
jgi:hypothetical protein